MKWLTRLLFERLSFSDKADLVLSTVHGIGIQSILTLNDDGVILVRGESLEGEKARVIRETARQTLHSPARKLVQEQLAYKASELALTSNSLEKLIFARAALWWGMEEEKLYKVLSGEGTSPL